MKKGYIEETPMTLNNIFSKHDFDNILEFETRKLSKRGKDSSDLDTKYSHRVVDSLFRQKIKKIDKDLNELQSTLKPQAKDIYFKRKIELTHLIAQKQLKDKNDLALFLKANEVHLDSQALTKQLKQIMNEYDIKHPLRGEQ
jgi:hypothetical protein